MARRGRVAIIEQSAEASERIHRHFVRVKIM